MPTLETLESIDTTDVTSEDRTVDQTESLDGRHARSARSRAAVVDALLDLLREGAEPPSAQEIADRAGVSLRTVFRLHDDMDSLFATALEHQMDRVGHRFEPLAPMSVEDFVAHRAALFEEIAGVRRAALRNDTHPVLQRGLADTVRKLRTQVETAFEVTGMTLEAIDAAASWAAWDSLRRSQGLSAARAKAVMEHTITALLREG